MDNTDKTHSIATFAGGCFWCIQHDFDKIPGVIHTIVGYTGGDTQHPTYEEVCSGRTGHVEAIQIIFDAGKISYKELLSRYWHMIDPTRDDGQFIDIGPQYTPAIFYHTDEQKFDAEFFKHSLLASKKFLKIAVQIAHASTFYPAEEYHQKYYQKCPLHYSIYSSHSGRKERLEILWNNENS